MLLTHGCAESVASCVRTRQWLLLLLLLAVVVHSTACGADSAGLAWQTHAHAAAHASGTVPSDGAASSSANATVVVDWGRVTRVSRTHTTLQVVVNPLLRPSSPIFAKAFDSLAALGADYVRFVPWLPYPKLGVAELDPPSGDNLCAHTHEGWNITLNCTAGGAGGRAGVVSDVQFASYGNPEGVCGAWTAGTCDAKAALATVRRLCENRTACVVQANTATFGDPCPGVAKRLVVQARCAVPGGGTVPNHTYWRFADIDPVTTAFLRAATAPVRGHTTAGTSRNHSVIINFSTPPEWLYKTAAPVPYPSNPNNETWSYEQGTQLLDPTATALGDYYGRLVAWYTRGGFTDEYGVFHESGHHFSIPFWECLNEPDSEHHHTVQEYTLEYDAMVAGIRRWADPEHRIKFVGLALANPYLYDWYSYFLNASHHTAGTPLDFISYHHYGSSTSRTDPDAYEAFFDQADAFIQGVRRIEAIRLALSPGTNTTIDEIGTILPGDNTPGAALPPAIYWPASGAMYAYIFGHLSLQGIDVLGESQLTGFPQLAGLDLAPQFPSVSLLNWTTGTGNARYWVLKMLLDHFQPGDSLIATALVPHPTAAAPSGVHPAVDAAAGFCGEVINLQTLTLACQQPGATITSVAFASYGTPDLSGGCGSFRVGACNAANSTSIVHAACIGKQSCRVYAGTDVFGDLCVGTVKHLAVQASCSAGTGFAFNTTAVYAQAFSTTRAPPAQGSADGMPTTTLQTMCEQRGSGAHSASEPGAASTPVSVRRVLIVNTRNVVSTATVPGASGGTAAVVDAGTGDGPPRCSPLATDTLTLQPFATAVVTMPA